MKSKHVKKEEKRNVKKGFPIGILIGAVLIAAVVLVALNYMPPPDKMYKQEPITINASPDQIINGSMENYIKERAEHFRRYGYETIFLTEDDIKCTDWEVRCLEKILRPLK